MEPGLLRCIACTPAANGSNGIQTSYNRIFIFF
jgi:hypothetical protein